MQIIVPVARIATALGETTLVAIGLGSCVAIALHARNEGIGALAHVLLPHSAHSAHVTPGKSAAIAVPAMIEEMRGQGATGEIQARLIGGASMFTALLRAGAVSLGTRNVQAARVACASSGIPIVAEDVGGETGRSVYFAVKSGQVTVRSVRKADVLL